MEAGDGVWLQQEDQPLMPPQGSSFDFDGSVTRIAGIADFYLVSLKMESDYRAL